LLRLGAWDALTARVLIAISLPILERANHWIEAAHASDVANTAGFTRLTTGRPNDSNAAVYGWGAAVEGSSEHNTQMTRAIPTTARSPTCWCADVSLLWYDHGMRTFEKHRDRAPVGSIPDVLDMFVSEVRFYREVAPVVGVRVPKCFAAEASPDGTRLILEDLSTWSRFADPRAVAAELARLHRRWEGDALRRWPWLRRPGLGAELIGDLFDRTWPQVAARTDLMPDVHALGDALVGHVETAELAEGTAGPLTLCHGDASLRNVFSSPSGEIAFVDWEDVRRGAGVTDLAWLLVSSVVPTEWDDVIDAYGPAPRLNDVLPAAAAQGLLSLARVADRSPDAADWVDRLAATSRRLSAG